MTLTDREKALVEAARELIRAWESGGMEDLSAETFYKLGDALLPYDIEQALTAKDSA